MKICLALLLSLAVVISAFVLLCEPFGSPLYINLTHYAVEKYVSKSYNGLLTVGKSEYQNGVYSAQVSDYNGSVYKMEYDPVTNGIRDGYYNDVKSVAESLYRNKVRKILEVNTRFRIPVDNISVSLEMPMFVYAVGSSGSGYDCSSAIVIALDNENSNVSDFAADSFEIINVLVKANIGMESIEVVSDYFILCASKNGFPANEASALLLVANRK